MIQRPIREITQEDLNRLVTNEAREDRTLEYKQALPGGGDTEKAEFLADVAALANTGGGDLVFGVVEKRDDDGRATGIPDAIPGVPVSNFDIERRRLDDMIRDGIAPRLMGIEYHQVDGFAVGSVLIARVPFSWQRPHMVKFKGLSRFHGRTSSGKYQMDIDQIRAAFAATSEIPALVARFRDSRIEAVLAGDLPVQLVETGKTLLHVVPFAALQGQNTLDPRSLAKHQAAFAAMGGQSSGGRFNLDGYVTWATTAGRRPWGYVQAFRSGAVESVDTILMEPSFYQEEPLLPSLSWEQEVLDAVARYVAALRDLEMPAPYAIVVSLVSVKDLRFGVENWPRTGQPRFDRDVVKLPSLVLESHDVDLARELRPLFDSLWQAAGLAGSASYDAGGLRIR